MAHSFLQLLGHRPDLPFPGIHTTSTSHVLWQQEHNIQTAVLTPGILQACRVYSALYTVKAQQRIHNKLYISPQKGLTKQKDNLKQRRGCHLGREEKGKAEITSAVQRAPRVAADAHDNRACSLEHLQGSSNAGTGSSRHFKHRDSLILRDLLPGVPVKPIGDECAQLRVKKLRKPNK